MLLNQNRELVESILRNGRELHLAMIESEDPYVLPLNYGYREGSIYIHSRRKGRKLDCLRAHPRVCFCVSEVVERVGGQRGCQWTTAFRSVVGYATARIIDDREEKIAGYDVLMAHFGGPVGDYEERYLQESLFICLELETVSVRHSEGLLEEGSRAL